MIVDSGDCLGGVCDLTYHSSGGTRKRTSEAHGRQPSHSETVVHDVAILQTCGEGDEKLQADRHRLQLHRTLGVGGVVTEVIGPSGPGRPVLHGLCTACTGRGVGAVMHGAGFPDRRDRRARPCMRAPHDSEVMRRRSQARRQGPGTQGVRDCSVRRWDDHQRGSHIAEW